MMKRGLVKRTPRGRVSG
ncbi:hypothetical protein HYV64_05230 [Candidatus Shapirobacteria bacterium]|nr:hypothetical protein [Candidatus Shapirobacteria bacterium]